jgi:hypothetical protein
MAAFMGRMSGLREIIIRASFILHTKCHSTLSYVLRNPTLLKLLEKLLEKLIPFNPGENEDVILDSMMCSLPITLRHGCKKVNNHTVGIGVLWGFIPSINKYKLPIKIYSVMEGAWSDSMLIRNIKLIPKSCTYIMDRGFYAIDLVGQWLKEKVNFIIRARENNLLFKVEKIVSGKRKYKDIEIELDAIVLLGAEKLWGKMRPKVRLIKALLPDGDTLILLTNLQHLSTEAILDKYKLRWQIEFYHRLLKRCVGLAHVYSFQNVGLKVMLYISMMLTIMMILEKKMNRCVLDVVKLIQMLLREHREAIDVYCGYWKPNMKCRVYQKKKNH